MHGSEILLKENVNASSWIYGGQNKRGNIRVLARSGELMQQGD